MLAAPASHFLAQGFDSTFAGSVHIPKSNTARHRTTHLPSVHGGGSPWACNTQTPGLAQQCRGSHTPQMRPSEFWWLGLCSAAGTAPAPRGWPLLMSEEKQFLKAVGELPLPCLKARLGRTQSRVLVLEGAGPRPPAGRCRSRPPTARALRGRAPPSHADDSGASRAGRTGSRPPKPVCAQAPPRQERPHKGPWRWRAGLCREVAEVSRQGLDTRMLHSRSGEGGLGPGRMHSRRGDHS